LGIWWEKFEKKMGNFWEKVGREMGKNIGQGHRGLRLITMLI